MVIQISYNGENHVYFRQKITSQRIYLLTQKYALKRKTQRFKAYHFSLTSFQLSISVKYCIITTRKEYSKSEHTLVVENQKTKHKHM